MTNTKDTRTMREIYYAQLSKSLTETAFKETVALINNTISTDRGEYALKNPNLIIALLEFRKSTYNELIGQGIEENSNKVG